LPADAESTSLPVVYVTPAADSSDPIKVALVSHVRARTNLRTIEVSTAALGGMVMVTGLFTALVQGSDGTAPVVIGLPLLAAGLLMQLGRKSLPPTESTVWVSTEGVTVRATDGEEYRAAWADMRSFTRSISPDGRDTVHLRWDLASGEQVDVVLGEAFDTTALDSALHDASGSRFGPTPGSSA